MQSPQYLSITQFILNGDTSPLDQDASPQKQKKSVNFKQPPQLEMSLNQLHKQRKRSVQQYTDELILWNNYLNHKFHHSEETNESGESL